MTDETEDNSPERLLHVVISDHLPRVWYRRTWTTMAEALADGHRHAEHPPEPALPETDERRCPACQSERTTLAGSITASGTLIKVKHRCEACSTMFWYVR